MVDLPDLDRTTLFYLVNGLGVVGYVTFLALLNFGVVEPSLELYIGVSIVWSAVLVGLVFAFGTGE